MVRTLVSERGRKPRERAWMIIFGNLCVSWDTVGDQRKIKGFASAYAGRRAGNVYGGRNQEQYHTGILRKGQVKINAYQHIGVCENYADPA